MSQNRRYEVVSKFPKCSKAFVDADTERVYAIIVETGYGFFEVAFLCNVDTLAMHASGVPETPGAYANVDAAVKATTAYLDYVLEHATAIR